jgi:S-adenosylmethionine:tRNA ribosyltransferase-isomerase
VSAAAAVAPARWRTPAPARDDARLLVATGAGGLEHTTVADLPRLLRRGDALVINTSATLPSALTGRRHDGTPIGLHLSSPSPWQEPDRWIVELRRDGRPARDGRPGERLALPGEGSATLLARYLGARLWIAALDLPAPVHDYLAEHGAPIRYAHAREAHRLDALQTVFATEPGSAEMPSAGRPFTAGLVTELVARGIDVAPLVLHCGVSSPDRDEPPHPERYSVTAATAARINLARELGGRVVAVGTTVLRALETTADAGGRVRAATGWSDLVLGPGRTVRAADLLLTGFHEPASSHAALLEAFAGPEPVRRAYAAALATGYERHELGDVQLLERAAAA